MPDASDISQLSAILDSMDEARLSQFGAVLSLGGSALTSYQNINKIPLVEYVYSLKDESNEAKAFRAFLKANEITCLSDGNSKNFKITPLDNSPPYILKLESWASPANLKDRLKDNPLLSPIYKERLTKRDSSSVAIQIVPLYSSDLSTFIYNKMSNNIRLSASLHIYEQMARGYEGFRQANIVFPDGKNANWLMDDQGTLVITDTKSLLYAPGGQLTTGLQMYKPYFMSIPENPPYDADKVHSLHLGKNLYQFLTKCHPDYLCNPTNPLNYDPLNAIKGCDANNYDFKLPIFKTPAGQRLKRLIKNMIQVNPTYRLSVADALLELSALKSELSAGAVEKKCTVGLLAHKQTVENAKKEQLQIKKDALVKECTQIVAAIESHKLSDNDIQMQAFVENQKLLISISNLHGLQQLSEKKSELNKTLEILERNKPIVDKIKKLISTYQHDTTLYKFGKVEKGNLIELAMTQVPIEQRGDILTSTTPEARSVRKALATRRGFIKNTLPLDEKGDIDENKATARFLQFKTAITALKAKNPAASTAVNKDVEHHSKNAPPNPSNN